MYMSPRAPRESDGGLKHRSSALLMIHMGGRGPHTDASVNLELFQYPLNSAESLARVGSKIRASSSDPRAHFVFRKDDGAARSIPFHIDDILGCREPDALPDTQAFRGHRSGTM